MFGKPHWFQMRRDGWGVQPVNWKGWLYAVIWAAAICVPFAALLLRGHSVESVFWAVVMLVALLWDVRQVRLEMAEPREVDAEILVIDDDTPVEGTHFATHSYDLHTRR